MMRGLIVEKKHCISVAVLCVIASLIGCAQTAIRDTFDLGVAGHAIDNLEIKKKNIQILVPAPTAVKALDGQDIEIKGADDSISYLKGAQWGDRLPNLVQARLIQAFENSGKLGGVGRPGEGLAINYQILSDIRSFNIVLMTREQRLAYVEIGVKIMDDKTGNIVASRIFKSQTLVPGFDNGQYAFALDNAFKLATKDIVNWVLAKI